MLRHKFIVELKPPTNPSDLGKYYDRVSALVELTGRVSIASKPSGSRISGFETSLNLASYILERKPTVDILFHLTCYDLNKVNIKSRLTSLKQLGIQRILVLTGDDYAQQMQQTRDSKWRDLFYKDSSKLLDEVSEHYKWFQTIAVGGYPGGDGRRSYDNEQEYSRLVRLLTRGANTVISQCVFDSEPFRELKLKLGRSFPSIDFIPSVALFKHANDLEVIAKLTRVDISTLNKLWDELGRMNSLEDVLKYPIKYLEELCKELLTDQPTIDLCTFGNFDLAETLIMGIEASAT